MVRADWKVASIQAVHMPAYVAIALTVSDTGCVA